MLPSRLLETFLKSTLDWLNQTTRKQRRQVFAFKCRTHLKWKDSRPVGHQTLIWWRSVFFSFTCRQTWGNRQGRQVPTKLVKIMIMIMMTMMWSKAYSDQVKTRQRLNQNPLMPVVQDLIKVLTLDVMCVSAQLRKNWAISLKAVNGTSLLLVCLYGYRVCIKK